MWLYRTSGDTDKPVVLYEYQPGRGAKHPKAFLEGYKGYLHTDGYAVYHGLPEGITKGMENFAKALHMAWANAKARNAAKVAAGISEEAHTWSGWKRLGYEVAHGSKALFQAVIIEPATKSGTRKTSYFGLSQVQAIEA